MDSSTENPCFRHSSKTSLREEYANWLDKHNQTLKREKKQENFLKLIKLTFSAEVAQARQASVEAWAEAYQTEAKHLKINLTLENIEKFFIEFII
ncbi:MAG: hypothetical protein MRERV_20c050 [Mycoplasmataceae bacterium RV_VA103A]|nr:MAG: hypothetical protein MRERV_20c050 [Mycoplasmataceae bacterium RV_VA103A]